VIANCSDYSIAAETCSTCQAGYYLATNGLACTAFPLGIPGCVTYSDISTCTKCDANMFYNQTQCQAVPAAKLITNCTYYKDINTCSDCALPSVQIGGSCVLTQAVNCSTVLSTTACATCPDRHGFMTTNGVTNCSPVSDAECLVFNMTFPFPCLVCKPHFYSSLGVCAAVSTTITGCIVYSAADKCARCTAPALLSVDGKSCVTNLLLQANFDPNCSLMSILPTPVCNKCKAGFVFNGTSCIACTGASLASGCYVCDPKNMTTCIACSSGYFMSTNGTCTKGPAPSTNSTGNATTNSTSNGTTNGSNNTGFNQTGSIHLIPALPAVLALLTLTIGLA
jgi:hypothetical protein